MLGTQRAVGQNMILGQWASKGLPFRSSRLLAVTRLLTGVRPPKDVQIISEATVKATALTCQLVLPII